MIRVHPFNRSSLLLTLLLLFAEAVTVVADGYPILAVNAGAILGSVLFREPDLYLVPDSIVDQWNRGAVQRAAIDGDLQPP